MKTLKNLLWAPWSLFHGLAATFAAIIFMFFKNNDGRKYPFIGHLSKFWGNWVGYGFGVKISILGLEKLDPGKRYVFMANHSSFIDPIVLMKTLPIALVTIVKKELREVFALGYGLEKSGVIFVDRENAEERVDVVKEMVEQLRQTILSLYVFPRGGRDKNRPFKNGGVRIAIECEMPIVPIKIVDSDVFWPKGTIWRLNRERVVQVIIHEPIDTGYLFGDSDDLPEVEYLCDLVREKIDS